MADGTEFQTQAAWWVSVLTMPIKSYHNIGHQQQLSNVSDPEPMEDILSISPQLYPTSSMSAIWSHLQKVLGLPLVLLPCWFHVRTWLVLLCFCARSAWPIQPNHMFNVSIHICPCLVYCHSGQWMMTLRLRQLLMTIWIFIVRYVSDPKSRTDFIFELNILILVGLLLHWYSIFMFLSWRKATTIALPIRALTSASVRPWLFTMLPRYVKASTSSSLLPPKYVCAVNGSVDPVNRYMLCFIE